MPWLEPKAPLAAVSATPPEALEGGSGLEAGQALQPGSTSALLSNGNDAAQSWAQAMWPPKPVSLSASEPSSREPERALITSLLLKISHNSHWLQNQMKPKSPSLASKHLLKLAPANLYIPFCVL